MKRKEILKDFRNEIVLVSVIVLLAGFSLAQVMKPQDGQGDETVTVVTSELIGFEPMAYAISHHKVPEPKGLNIRFKTASMTQAELHTMATEEQTVGILSNERMSEIGRAHV